MRKDDQVLGLFLSAVLAFTSGCSSHTHVDRDHNGYCDTCNTAMSTSSGSSGHNSYWGNSGGSNSSSSPDTSSNHISTASSPKGGIGSHSSGSGS